MPENWAALVEDMNLRIAITSLAFGVGPEFTWAMDEMFVFFVPMGGTTTLEVQGAKHEGSRW